MENGVATSGVSNLTRKRTARDRATDVGGSQNHSTIQSEADTPGGVSASTSLSSDLSAKSPRKKNKAKESGNSTHTDQSIALFPPILATNAGGKGKAAEYEVVSEEEDMDISSEGVSNEQEADLQLTESAHGGGDEVESVDHAQLEPASPSLIKSTKKSTRASAGNIGMNYNDPDPNHAINALNASSGYVDGLDSNEEGSTPDDHGDEEKEVQTAAAAQGHLSIKCPHSAYRHSTPSPTTTSTSHKTLPLPSFMGSTPAPGNRDSEKGNDSQSDEGQEIPKSTPTIGNALESNEREERTEYNSTSFGNDGDDEEESERSSQSSREEDEDTDSDADDTSNRNIPSTQNQEDAPTLYVSDSEACSEPDLDLYLSDAARLIRLWTSIGFRSNGNLNELSNFKDSGLSDTADQLNRYWKLHSRVAKETRVLSGGQLEDETLDELKIFFRSAQKIEAVAVERVEEMVEDEAVLLSALNSLNLAGIERRLGE
ncbi:hypothetical protein FRB90_005084 [Tulasnella sp. 427]|nr:hypothetical protein FRB90_005084 [Tulasnella sp. 427]